MHHICECEHIKHFPAAGDDPSGKHEYLAMAYNAERYPTSFGVMHLCEPCAEECLKADIANARQDLKRRTKLKAQMNYLGATARYHERQAEKCNEQIDTIKDELKLLGETE